MKLNKIEEQLKMVLQDINENISENYFLIVTNDTVKIVDVDFYKPTKDIIYSYNLKEVILKSKRLRYNIGYRLEESIFFFIMWEIVRKEIINNG